MDSRSLIVLSSLPEHNSTLIHCPFLDHLVNGGEERAVGGDYATIDTDEARSALAWWLESGVDAAIQEDPRDWLSPAPPRPAPDVAPVPNVIEPSHDTLAELQQWLASSAQLPLATATARRILPHGPQNASVMLLSGAPALEDFAAKIGR